MTDIKKKKSIGDPFIGEYLLIIGLLAEKNKKDRGNVAIINAEIDTHKVLIAFNQLNHGADTTDLFKQLDAIKSKHLP